MKTSPTGIALIKRFEGFAARVYVCPAGYPTIGYGHVVRGAVTHKSPLPHRGRGLGEGAVRLGHNFDAPSPNLSPLGGEGYAGARSSTLSSSLVEISELEADRLLAADLRMVEAAVRRLIHAPLTQNQFDALVSFTFNLGAGRLQMSRLRMVINRGDYTQAPKEFRRWVYGGGRKLPGLIARRQAEIALYNSVG